MTGAQTAHRFLSSTWGHSIPIIRSRDCSASASYSLNGDTLVGLDALGEKEGSALTPEELGRWLYGQREAMAERWLLELLSRSEDIEEELLVLVREHLLLLTSLLPVGLGPFREEAEAILQQAAELYGGLAAHRGLAAGEAVEEVQLMRGVLLRFFHTISPVERGYSYNLRDLLQLNRLIDLVVTYTSVGHTDALFFKLFHGTEVSGDPVPEVLAEIWEQVEGMRDELATLPLADDGDVSGPAQ